MPPKQTTRRKKTAVRPASRQTRPAGTPLPRKAWTVLIYMCGDNDLESFIDADFAELCGVGSLPDMHLVVQCDRRQGARRYILPEGPCDGEPVFDVTLDHVRVNTGEPAEAIKFLLWGIEQAPSEHVAVIFSGLGISPHYVRQRLLSSPGAPGEQVTDTQVQQQLFSICHDLTSHERIGIPKPLFSPRAAAASPVASARLPRPRAMTPCWAPRRRGGYGEVQWTPDAEALQKQARIYQPEALTLMWVYLLRKLTRHSPVA